MEYVLVIVIAAVAFGLCFLVDKGFTKLFRNQAQHKSGRAVRLNKRYGSIGLIVAVLGVAALVAGIGDKSWLMIAAGSALLLVGAALVVYYMTFGVFYDEGSFILTTFGKKSRTYRYADIKGQQLYANYGSVVIEIFMRDGRTFQLQSGMKEVYPFMDYAFERWLEQTGRDRESCDFHDPEKSCWFPQMEEA